MEEKPGPRPIVWMLILGAMLIAIALWGVFVPMAGLQSVHLKPDGMPLTVLYPRAAQPGERPLVLIGHGFAGSASAMRGFSLSLACAGYVVAVWDFDGHGYNSRSFASGDLLANAEAALAEVGQLGLADASRFAILGHSMGSGVALAFGQAHPETSATIAVSPTGTQVTPQLPRNLLLMAGSYEPRFLQNAQERLAEAGGAGGDPAQGSGRRLVEINGVEHISILFAPQAQRTARQWLDEVFGEQPGRRDYQDLRVVWYMVGILGCLLVGIALAPLTDETVEQMPAPRPMVRVALGMFVGVLAASFLLYLVSLLGVKLGEMLGIPVGGYMLFWFGLAGIIGLVVAGVRPRLPSRRALLGALVVFLSLWLGLGLLGNYVWLSWLLIPRRLVFWPLGILLLLPWSYLAAEAACRGGVLAKLGGWALQTLLLVAGIFLAMHLNAELGFIMLILPLFPIVLGLHALAAAPQRGRWSFALGSALFISWMLLSVFPLS